MPPATPVSLLRTSSLFLPFDPAFLSLGDEHPHCSRVTATRSRAPFQSNNKPSERREMKLNAVFIQFVFGVCAP